MLPSNIFLGREKLSSVPVGGGPAVAASAAGGASQVVEEKKGYFFYLNMGVHQVNYV